MTKTTVAEMAFKLGLLNSNPIVKEALEKEKEQRINDFVEGFKISGEGWNGEYGIKDFNNIKEEIKAEELINKTYKNNNENKN